MKNYKTPTRNKINNINGAANITAYIKDKVSRYEAVEKNFENLKKMYDEGYSDAVNRMDELKAFLKTEK